MCKNLAEQLLIDCCIVVLSMSLDEVTKFEKVKVYKTSQSSTLTSENDFLHWDISESSLLLL